MNIWNVFSEPTLVILHTLLCEYLLAGIFFLGSYLSSLYSTFTLSPAALYGTTASSSSFSLEHAAYSFHSYSAVAASEANVYRSKFNTLRGAHRRLAVEIGYSAKIEMLKEASMANSSIARAIYDLARAEFPFLNTSMTSTRARGMKQDIGRVRESLKHLVRDWSSEGARERDVIFAPILTELRKIPPERRSGHRVLVPGAGLGRLAWEIASMGFDTTSCELSYYMNLSLRFLLSPQTTATPDQHTVHPYVHWWSHQRSNQNTFRGISVPDVLPRRMPNWTILEEDFLGLSHPQLPPYLEIRAEPEQRATEDRGYDTIVTLYFIDTASNIISYITHIHHLLKADGTWINLGPLLYSSAVIELCLEEVLRLATSIGLEIDGSSLKQIPSEYTADNAAMMKWIYQAQFWVARKRSIDPWSDLIIL